MACCGSKGSLVLGLIAGGAIALLGTQAFSQNKEKGKDAGGAPQMTPEMQAMMDKWAAYMTPGDAHMKMMKHVGKWSMKTRMRMDPNSDFQECTGGTSEITSIFGGRYLLEKVSAPPCGETMPMPFEGMNVIGYDNFQKKYVYTWCDNMGTGLMAGEGTASADGKTITYWAECPDFMTGKMKKCRSVMNMISDDEFRFEMYDTAPDGKEYKGFEGIYTRAK
ncbi:MAG TPA: DUF1579 domain-containing protein [Phycisphaerales bacterium]|nr:DUF1579 domain-containing protein [Phycisphaerales bacterium]